MARHSRNPLLRIAAPVLLGMLLAATSVAGWIAYFVAALLMPVPDRGWLSDLFGIIYIALPVAIAFPFFQRAATALYRWEVLHEPSVMHHLWHSLVLYPVALRGVYLTMWCPGNPAAGAVCEDLMGVSMAFTVASIGGILGDARAAFAIRRTRVWARPTDA